jgi:ubiquinone/menaquinone biosynthesis C-methylase UbiE
MSDFGRINWWPDADCAKAFWRQHDFPPYQQLLADTLDWADPGPQERWLDLGCGAGTVSRAIWERTSATVGTVVGVDCAAVNEHAYRRLRATLSPTPADRLQFIHHNFSDGLGVFPDAVFDHAVSGLSISYAEFYDEAAGRWTGKAYDQLLAEVRRVIRPGGRFVFSVNVPEPSWVKVALGSLTGWWRSDRPLRSLRCAWRMLRYGHWLKQEARAGRFHYLSAAEVTRRLTGAGFTAIAHRLSYCDQAYIFRALKPI